MARDEGDSVSEAATQTEGAIVAPGLLSEQSLFYPTRPFNHVRTYTY